ncbi:MAG: YmdB family metallophosphoesterase [Ruminococcaceae bacterium]|nr:YmdB family metallophosphoesterase [Oscillospiraceae bacterium]
MKILAIGDVTSPRGIEHLEKNLWRIRKNFDIDLCVVNGENASFVTGISPELADLLLKSGADVITGGNHTLRNRAAFTYLDDCREILRPVNFGDSAPGRGYTVADVNGYRILVISALGNVHMEPTLDSPFSHVDRVLRELDGKYDFSILDIHAEATGEKLAIGYAYDGKINIVFGTHTHVQTADEKILPNGTGYITDVGMCGESGGILGMDADSVVERMRTKIPYKFKASAGKPEANGVIFTLDSATGRVTNIERLTF